MSDNLVKRYRMQGDYSDWWMAEVDGDGDGYDDASETEWVKANDHAAALVAKDAEIARLARHLQAADEYLRKGLHARAFNVTRAALNTQHKGETP